MEEIKEKTKNLCAHIPESLHNRVREAQQSSGMTLNEYMTMLITEYYDRKDKTVMKDKNTRTLATKEKNIMPKKKGNKLPKGARQNKREKMLARKQNSAQASAAETVEEAAKTAEPAEAVAAVATPAAEKAATAVMTEKKPTEKKATAAIPTEKKKPGRKPMTEEQKAEARKQREELNAAAVSAKTTVYIQYKGMEDGVEDLVAAARADYKATHKRTPINSIKLYVKPEEYTAYYVVNDSYFGKVNM